MEGRARRRIALVTSHINPSPTTTSMPCVVEASCVNGQEQDCIFCKIIHHQAPAFKIYEDDECLCILDIYPLCHGHSLIIPKCHFPSLDVTPPSIIGTMCSKVPLISSAVMKATGSDSFNLLVNNGMAAGQVVFHFNILILEVIYGTRLVQTHIHIIPRKEHDCLWESETIRRRPLKLDEEASQLVNSIRENLLLPNNCEDDKGQATDVVGN